MTSSPDRERLRSVYRWRDRAGEFWDFRTFHCLDPQICFTESLFRDHLFDILRRDGYDFDRADQARVVEIGCGWGRNLHAFLDVGFRASNVAGVDLMEHFIERGRTVDPALRIAIGDGAELAEASASIDLVLCHTVMSAILDADLHRRLIAEALRVLKPGGLLIVFDILPNYPESTATTAEGRETTFIRPVAPDLLTVYAGDRASRVYFRSMGLRRSLRAAIFLGWWHTVGRKLRLTRGASATRRFYTARAFVARLLGALPPLRTHFILALKRTDGP